MAKKRATRKRKADPSRGLSRSAYAAHRKKLGLPGTTINAVKKALAEGRIEANPDGRIDPEVADAAWAANSNTRTAVGTASYQEARSRREHYNAELARLSFEQKQGSLIDAAEARRDGFAIGREVRDSLLAITERVAPLLASLEDPREISTLLDRELRQALAQLAGGEEADE